MRELTFDEFCIAWSSYWGRREIGFVIHNQFAAQVAARPEAMPVYFEQWKAALAAFPNDAPLWLMGTPNLTPELIPSVTDVVVDGDADEDATTLAPPLPPPPPTPPPPPRIGRYAEHDLAAPHPRSAHAAQSAHSAQSAQSERAGDYEVTLPRTSEPAQHARTVLRAGPGASLGFLSLLIAWFPLISIPMAVLGLAWTVPAHRIVRRRGVPWRRQRGLVVGEALAVLSLILSGVFIVTTHSLLPLTPREDVTVTHIVEGSLSGDIVSRLLAHWPDAEITIELIDNDPDRPSFVRVRVAENVYLDATPGEMAWQVRPMSDGAGGIQPASASRPYTIGVTTPEGADAVADRFYEEIRFWWARLHPELDGLQTA